jgi:uncharacterized OsmC-like protein
VPGYRQESAPTCWKFRSSRPAPHRCHAGARDEDEPGKHPVAAAGDAHGATCLSLPSACGSSADTNQVLSTACHVMPELCICLSGHARRSAHAGFSASLLRCRLRQRRREHDPRGNRTSDVAVGAAKRIWWTWRPVVPETLLVASFADCFVLTFRAVAVASKVSWTTSRCDVTGTLDRVDRVAQFTSFDIRVELAVPAGTNEDQARRALEKAERNCLISNSLKATVHLKAAVQTEPVHAPAASFFAETR